MPHSFQKQTRSHNCNSHTSQINVDLANKYSQEFLPDKSNK